MMTATKDNLSRGIVTLHKVDTLSSGIGMPSKKGKTYASKQMFVMYEHFWRRSLPTHRFVCLSACLPVCLPACLSLLSSGEVSRVAIGFKAV